MDSCISIVIVNWNGKKWLQKCFDSLLAQTDTNIEIVMVDNGSTDNSALWVKEHYPTITLIESKQNLGFAGGNNLGIEKARGTYIMLLNTDTWVEPDFIKTLREKYQSTGVDIVAPQQIPYEIDAPLPRKETFFTIDLLGHPVTSAWETQGTKFFFSSGACLFFSKEFYLATGGLDNNFFMYNEEVDWFWRIHLFKKTALQLQDVFYHHAEGGSTGGMGKLKYKIFLWRNENTLQMLLKNYRASTLLWILPLYFLQNIFEILFFTLIGKFKIAWSYVEGWWFNIKNIEIILTKRSRIQKQRLVSDHEIINKMHLGPGKLKHFIHFYQDYFTSLLSRS